jgi:protocatechuate 3,4-dioxygenase beta subunit
MTNHDATPTASPTVIAIWQADAVAKWLVPVESDHDPDDHWSGWLDINADANNGTVEVQGVDLTPDEARLAARALMSAADHVELFTWRRCETLSDLISPGRWPELDNEPVEFQAAARDAVRAAVNRIRTGSRGTT